MNRSYSKIRHIQESNNRLEKRILNEQTEKELVGKTIDIFTDKTLSQKLNSVEVSEAQINGNSIIIKFNNGIRGQEGNSIIDSMTIQCGSNIATMKEILVMMGSGPSQKNITGYVSQKLVDYLKPLICKETQETPTKPSDF